MKANMVDLIIDYESGQLNDKKTLELFGQLIRTGQAWSLQGHYCRTASALIQDNWINKNGEINYQKVEENELC